MNDLWLEMCIRVPAAAADLLGVELAALGCAGLTVEERLLDTFIPPDPEADLPAAYLVKAYFPPGTDPRRLRRKVRSRLARLARFVPGLDPVLPEVRSVRQEDWAEGWKQHFGVVRIGRRLVVKPSWEAFAAAGDDVVIELDPGMAFGTGTHGTTRLCLEALAQLFDGPRPPRRVLDVGTGSGILAIAAAALGAGQVVACDIDPESCRVAAENAGANGVATRVAVTDRPLASLPGGFDLVLANILAEENIRLAPELAGRLAPGGVLVLSGILHEKEGEVAAAFSAFPLTPPEISRSEEWSCLLLRRTP